MEGEIDKYITRPRIMDELVHHNLGRAKKEMGLLSIKYFYLMAGLVMGTSSAGFEPCAQHRDWKKLF